MESYNLDAKNKNSEILAAFKLNNFNIKYIKSTLKVGRLKG